MLKQSEEKIGIREIFCLVIFTIGVKITDSTPAILFQTGENAAWITVFIIALVNLFPFLLLLSVIKRYPGMNYISIGYKLAGKLIGFIIGILSSAIFFASTLLNSRDDADILSTLFYHRTPKVVLLGALILTACYISKRGLETIGRSCWFCFPVLEGIVAVLFFSTLKDVSITNIYPIWGPGKINLLKTGITRSTVFADLLLVAVFAPNIRSYKEFKMGSLLGFSLATVNFSILCVVLLGIFGYPNIKSISYPFQILTRAATFGRFATNIEGFFLGFWVIATVFRYSIYLYTTAALIGYTFQLKNFEKLLFPISLLIIFLGLIPENFIVVVYELRGKFLGKEWIFFVSYPVLLWILSKVRGHKQDEKD